MSPGGGPSAARSPDGDGGGGGGGRASLGRGGAADQQQRGQAQGREGPRPVDRRVHEPVDPSGGERRPQQRPPSADERDAERQAEPEREQDEADDPGLAELVELERVGALRRLDAPPLLEVDRCEAAAAYAR